MSLIRVWLAIGFAAGTERPDFTVTGYAAPEARLLAQARAHTLYVAPNGLDAWPGTPAQPFRTLARADRAAAPGTTVYVAPGLYYGGFQTHSSGSERARIVYISSTRWGARIVPPPNAASNSAWDNRASHVDIIGFEVDGSAWQGGTRWTHGIYSGGSHVSLRRNHVHDIAREAPCTSAGGSAIGADSYYQGVQAHVLGNLVHDVGPAGCRFFQGIYMSTSGSVKNNVVYRVAEGAIHLWHDARDVVIANNTVSASNTGIIVGGGDFYHTRGPNDHTAVLNNIVYDNVVGISEQGSTGKNNTYRNNLVYQNRKADWQLKNGNRHSGTVRAPPRFVQDARGAAPDLRIGPGSPAIGRGTPLHAERVDFEGRARDPARIDIGAHQHDGH